MTTRHEVPSKGPTDIMSIPAGSVRVVFRLRVFLAKLNVRQTVEMDEAPGSVKSAVWWDEACPRCAELAPQLLGPVSSAGSLARRIKITDEWYSHMKSVHFKKKRHGNGVPNGAFAFTLTKSPKDPHTVGDMLAAVRKIVRQRSCPVVKYAWYYEDKGRDENGDPIHPHIHGLYETESGGRIERKHWMRAWDLWDETKPMGAGFKGGYHRPVKDGECYKDYIKKDGGMSESWKKTE